MKSLSYEQSNRISIVPGADLFECQTEAIVNPVNTMGISGAGLALKFKEKYPGNQYAYEYACKSKDIAIGRVYVCPVDDSVTKYIVNFPTKDNWRNPSRYSYIADGLVDLARKIKDFEIKSIAIPALGCGLGGLIYSKVEQQIVDHLYFLPVRVIIIPPKD